MFLSYRRFDVFMEDISIIIHSQDTITDKPRSRLKHYDYSLFSFLSSLSGCIP